MALSKNWQQLKNLPSTIISGGKIIPINPNQFIYASRTKQIYDNDTAIAGIHIYNAIQNKWTLFMEYEDLDFNFLQLLFDNDQNKLYIFCKRKPTYFNHYICIDLETKKYSGIYEIRSPSDFLVNVGDNIHMIGGRSVGDKHRVYDIGTLRTVSMKALTDQPFQGFALIYVASQDVILLIGGCDENENYLSIWKFCIPHKKWSKISKITFPYIRCRAMLTKDERYVIIACGIKLGNTGKRKICTDIRVLDIRDKHNYVLRKSKVKAPMMSRRYPVGQWTMTDGRLRSDIIVEGYIKKLFRGMMMTKDVVGIIIMYHNDELVHCIRFDRDKSEHFVASLSDILS